MLRGLYLRESNTWERLNLARVRYIKNEFLLFSFQKKIHLVNSFLNTSNVAAAAAAQKQALLRVSKQKVIMMLGRFLHKSVTWKLHTHTHKMREEGASQPVSQSGWDDGETTIL